MWLHLGDRESEAMHITPTAKARKIYHYEKIKIHDFGNAISILTKILLKSGFLFHVNVHFTFA